MNAHPFWQALGLLMLVSTFAIAIGGAGLGIYRMYRPKRSRYQARIESDLIPSRCDIERIKEAGFIAVLLGVAFILAMAI